MGRIITKAENGNLFGAFGENLSATLYPAVQVSFAYNIHEDLVNTTTAAGGTVVQSAGNAVLTAPNGGSAVLETKDVVRYGAGQGVTVRFTAGWPNKGLQDTKQLIGIGDENDGFFIGFSGKEFVLQRRKGGVDINDRIPMDTSELQLGNVFQIRFQWLGYGRVTFYMENRSSGEFFEIGSVDYAGTDTTPSIYNPTLPLRVETSNTGYPTDATMFVGSLGGYTEGPPPTNFVRKSYSSTKASVTAETPIFTLRNRTSFASITNRTIMNPDFLDIDVGQGNVTYRFRYIVNDSLDGTEVFSDLDTNRSIVEVDTTAAALNGDGIELLSIISEGEKSNVIPLSDLALRTRPGESVTITAQRLSGGTTPIVAASMSWQERF